MAQSSSSTTEGKLIKTVWYRLPNNGVDWSVFIKVREIIHPSFGMFLDEK